MMKIHFSLTSLFQTSRFTFQLFSHCQRRRLASPVAVVTTAVHRSMYAKPLPDAIQGLLQQLCDGQGYRSTTWWWGPRVDELAKPGESAHTVLLDASGKASMQLYNQDQLVMSKCEEFLCKRQTNNTSTAPSTENKVQSPTSAYHDFRHTTRKGTKLPKNLQEVMHKAWLERGFTSTKWIGADYCKVEVSEGPAVSVNGEKFYNMDQLQHFHDFRHARPNEKKFPSHIQELLHTAWLERKYTSTVWYTNVPVECLKNPNDEPVNGFEEKDRFFNLDQLSCPPENFKRPNDSEMAVPRHISSFSGKMFPVDLCQLLEQAKQQNGFTSNIWFTDPGRAAPGAIPVETGRGKPLYNEDQKNTNFHDFRHVNSRNAKLKKTTQEELQPMWVERGFTSTMWYNEKYDSGVLRASLKPNEEPCCVGGESWYNRDQLNCGGRGAAQQGTDAVESISGKETLSSSFDPTLPTGKSREQIKLLDDWEAVTSPSEKKETKRPTKKFEEPVRQILPLDSRPILLVRVADIKPGYDWDSLQTTPASGVIEQRLRIAQSHAKFVSNRWFVDENALLFINEDATGTTIFDGVDAATYYNEDGIDRNLFEKYVKDMQEQGRGAQEKPLPKTVDVCPPHRSW